MQLLNAVEELKQALHDNADAMTYYRQKHAPVWHVDEYRIIFEPFSVAKHQPRE